MKLLRRSRVAWRVWTRRPRIAWCVLRGRPVAYRLHIVGGMKVPAGSGDGTTIVECTFTPDDAERA